MSANPKMDTEFECTYKKVELKYIAELPKMSDGTVDVGDEEDILFLCEEVYREEFLKFFGISFFDEDVINRRVSELFKLCNANERFHRISSSIQEKYCVFVEDPEHAFMQLFSYQFFHLTHECIKQLVNPLLTHGLTHDLAFELLENEVRLFNTE